MVQVYMNHTAKPWKGNQQLAFLFIQNHYFVEDMHVFVDFDDTKTFWLQSQIAKQCSELCPFKFVPKCFYHPHYHMINSNTQLFTKNIYYRD